MQAEAFSSSLFTKHSQVIVGIHLVHLFELHVEIGLNIIRVWHCSKKRNKRENANRLCSWSNNWNPSITSFYIKRRRLSPEQSESMITVLFWIRAPEMGFCIDFALIESNLCKSGSYCQSPSRFISLKYYKMHRITYYCRLVDLSLFRGNHL